MVEDFKIWINLLKDIHHNQVIHLNNNQLMLNNKDILHNNQLMLNNKVILLNLVMVIHHINLTNNMDLQMK